MDSGDFSGTERFEIAARLGAGGMGIVYKAYDREHGTHVALKTLARIDPRDLLRFKAEFRALSDVRHPNLVSFGELYESTGRWFFTMELVDGVDFHTWVSDATWAPDAPTLVDPAAGQVDASAPSRPRASRYDETRLRAALALAARGLAALHGAGKVHRDIKPSNIMVTREGRVVILDFGLVTDALPTHPSLDTQIAGTVAYMSPEQAASRTVGPESDWYSVGVMLYEILTGRLPHTGAPLEILMNKQRVDPEPPRRLVPSVPEDLDRLCMALLRFEPAARPREEEILRRLAVDAAPELTVSRSSSSDPAAVFIGREAALTDLGRRFQDTRRGKPSTLCLVGESGVGKSALVHHFTQTAQRDVPETVVLSGRCYETEWVPFKALDGVIDALSSYLSRIPRADAAELMPRHAALLAQVFPVLRRVDVIAQAPRPLSDALPPQELRTHVFAAVRELFARLADRRPLILTIDDLQWADSDSMALLREVLREPDAPKLLLLLTMRPRPPGGTFDPRQLIGAEAEVLPLDSLPPDEARDLARLLLGPKTGDEATTIAGEAGGHPLFIQELVRHRQTVGAGGPAPRLDEALGARVARLDAAARRLLEVICLAGGPIGQELSAHAAELELSAFARQVSVLRVASMVRTTGTRGWDRIEPYHDRIREAVVARLDDTQRRKLHRRLALAFEGSAAPDPEMLVLHWQGTGEHVVAARHAVAAARRASQSLAFDRAARFYRIALDLGPRGPGSSPRDTPSRELWELLGDALANAGRGGEAAAAYFSATEDANQAEALDLRRRGAEQLLRSGHVDDGLEAIAEVLRAVDLSMPQTPRRALAALLARRAQIRLRGLRFTERDVSTIPARDLARVDVCWAASTNLGLVDFIIGAYFQSVSLVLALRAGDPRRVVRALAAEATYSSAAGGPARKHTAALVETTRALAERLGDPYSKAWVELAVGASATLEGRWANGRDGCLQAETMFRDECTGGAWEITTVRWFGALSIAYTGELAVLSRRVHEALRQADDRGDLYATVGQSTGQPNLVWLVADDPAQARTQLRDAMARWSRREAFHVEHWWAMQAEAQIDLYEGNGAAAVSGLAARWPALERSLIMRCQLTRLEAWSVRGRSALLAGDLRAAEQDARRIEREGMVWSNPVAALLRAGVAAARGNDEKAIALLTTAVPAFESAGMALHATVARRRLGALRGGESGRDDVTSADAWMVGQDVRRPDRLAAVLAPGFRD